MIVFAEFHGSVLFCYGCCVYTYTYMQVKKRWDGKTIVDLFADEFRQRPHEYYVCAGFCLHWNKLLLFLQFVFFALFEKTQPVLVWHHCPSRKGGRKV